jgi:hypothetical protein
MDEFLINVGKWLGGQLGPGGFVLLLMVIFLAWRWTVRDDDDRTDREQMAKEADARTVAMTRLAQAIETINSDQKQALVGISDLRVVLERISTLQITISKWNKDS